MSCLRCAAMRPEFESVVRERESIRAQFTAEREARASLGLDTVRVMVQRDEANRQRDGWERKCVEAESRLAEETARREAAEARFVEREDIVMARTRLIRELATLRQDLDAAVRMLERTLGFMFHDGTDLDPDKEYAACVKLLARLKGKP